MEEKRSLFSSRFGYIMSAAGFAIGLGNVWRFPYLVGKNGGGAFVLIYLVICLLVALPLLSMEVALGRKAGASPIIGMRELTKKGSPWVIVGWLSLMVPFFVLTYYIQIMGWILSYVFKMASGNMMGYSPEQISAVFGNMTSSPAQLIFWTVVCVLIIATISSRNLNAGLEKACKFMMPALFIMMLIVVVRSLTLPGAMEGVKWYLKPDFSSVNFNTVLNALGQCFYSVGIASGGFFVYGSYLKKDSNIPADGLMIVGFDTMAALIAGFAIFPAIFALGLSPDSGPNLLFVTMSNLFTKMPFGQIFGVIFFLLMFFAALTSVLGLIEPISTTISDLFNISRAKGVLAALFIEFTVGLFTIFGQNVLSHIKILGRDMFSLADFLASNILLPTSAIALVIFVIFKWKFENFKDEVNEGATYLKVTDNWKYIVYVLPVLLVIIFVTGLM